MTKLGLLKVVYEDLCFLRDEWNDRIDSKTIRITGPILRKLLVEDRLQIAWNEINTKIQPPNFKIGDVDRIAGNFSSAEIVIILSGSAEYNGGSAGNIVLTEGTIKPPIIPAITVSLNKFKNSTCIQIKHIKINNQELINYVCNKLGGVHYDDKRKNNKSESKYKYLDYLLENQTWVKINLLGLDPVLFQFLSIGQIINRSNDIRNFIEKLKNTRTSKKKVLS